MPTFEGCEEEDKPAKSTVITKIGRNTIMLMIMMTYSSASFFLPFLLFSSWTLQSQSLGWMDVHARWGSHICPEWGIRGQIGLWRHLQRTAQQGESGWGAECVHAGGPSMRYRVRGGWRGCLCRGAVRGSQSGYSADVATGRGTGQICKHIKSNESQFLIVRKENYKYGGRENWMNCVILN